MTATRGRVWVYSNYHCNLACTYCLTDSAPAAQRRQLTADTIRRVAVDAADLGFDELGITGGEPFLLPFLPGLLDELAGILPVVVLTNGTLFTEARLERLRPLSGKPVRVQVSLDSADPVVNDAARGEENFRKVVDAIPRLVALGITVRIATTASANGASNGAMARLCELHRRLGVTDDDHVVRPIVRRGRAANDPAAVAVTPSDLPAELTITADGAFWSPFGPTVRGGTLDTDLLVTRTTAPLRVPAEALARLVQGRPPGDDARLGIR